MTKFNDDVDLTTGEVKKKKALGVRAVVILLLLVAIVVGGKYVYTTWLERSEADALRNAAKAKDDKIAELESKLADAIQQRADDAQAAADKQATLGAQISEAREQTKAFALQAKACAVLQQKLKQ